MNQSIVRTPIIHLNLIKKHFPVGDAAKDCKTFLVVYPINIYGRSDVNTVLVIINVDFKFIQIKKVFKWRQKRNQL